DDDVETPGRAAAGAGFAFILEPQLLPGGDPRGDLDGDLAIARDPAGAAAGLARLRDDLAGAAALRAGARHREEALLKADLALAFALRTGARRRSRRRAGAVARPAIFLARNLDRRLGAARRLLEADLEVVAQVGSALRAAAAPPAAAE